MSKKTRKKSSKASSAKVSGTRSAAGSTPASRKAADTKGSRPAAKSSKRVAKAPSKVAAKKPAKTAGKTVAKAAVKKPAKTPPKVSRTAPKTTSAASLASPPPTPKFASEGARAPAFHLRRDGGEQVSLADYAGRQLVIFFYPRADTPGCTKEAMDFTRLQNDFAAAGTAVLGVSADPVKAQESFRDKHQLTIPLLSDEAHEMLEAYGAWGEKSMYGRTFLGVLRTTVLVDPKGVVARIWRGVKVDGHAEAVLAAAREL